MGAGGVMKPTLQPSDHGLQVPLYQTRFICTRWQTQGYCAAGKRSELNGNQPTQIPNPGANGAGGEKPSCKHILKTYAKQCCMLFMVTCVRKSISMEINGKIYTKFIIKGSWRRVLSYRSR